MTIIIIIITIIGFVIWWTVANVTILFLIDRNNEHHDRIGYSSYCDGHIREEWAWGSRDIINLGGTTSEQRMAYLRDAANFCGGAVYLLFKQNSITQEEENAWLEAFSMAANHDAAPKSLLIQGKAMTGRPLFNTYDLLSALKKSNGLTHLSLLRCPMRSAMSASRC